MKKLILKLLTLINTHVLYRKCPNQVVKLHNQLMIFKKGIIQKIFRINAHVYWPVSASTQVNCPENIKIGTRTPGLAISCYLDGTNGIEFGENVWVGPRVSIITKNHNLSNFNEYINKGPVVIGKDSWLATNATILPGVVLGERTVVAAGAVVTKAFPDGNQVLAGNPARVIKKL